MDDPALAPDIKEAALRGLEAISGWPGQREPLFRELRRILGPPSSRRVRLVEVGAGSGHLSRWTEARLMSLGYSVEVVATDRVAAPGVLAVDCLDLKKLPDADLYFSNLLLHHLDDPALTKMFEIQHRKARLGFAHYDLHRHVLHYYGAMLALRFSGLHPILLHDGLRSIQQGYARRDLRILAPMASIRWRFPFRWLVSWRR